MNYFLALALLGFVATGCCSMKKNCPMKDHAAMATEEKMVMTAEAVEPVAAEVAPVVEAVEDSAAQVAK